VEKDITLKTALYERLNSAYQDWKDNYFGGTLEQQLDRYLACTQVGGPITQEIASQSCTSLAQVISEFGAIAPKEKYSATLRTCKSTANQPTTPKPVEKGKSKNSNKSAR
jgi:hypothetical protein